jgi:TPR repeat protein
MILIQQFLDYRSVEQTPEIIERKNEILFCLKKNIENPLIEKIILLNEEDVYEDLFNHEKVEAINIKQRLSYQTAFEYGNKYPDQIVIVANDDVYFDDSLQIIKNWNPNWDDKIIAITRHETLRDGSIVPIDRVHPIYNRSYHHYVELKRIWSHDAWCFKSPLKQFDCDFWLGVLGCEGLLVDTARKAGLDIINAYPYVRCIHYHMSNVRLTKARTYKLRWTPSLVTKDILGQEHDSKSDKLFAKKLSKPDFFNWCSKLYEQTKKECWVNEHLAECYEKGLGTTQDHNKAFEIIKMSAELGGVFSMEKLADYYHSGIGTGSSFENAFVWYQRALDAMEHCDSWVTEMQYNTLSIKFNTFKKEAAKLKKDRALKFYKDFYAINTKNFWINEQLANCFAEGKGTSQNIPMAIKLIKYTASIGSPSAMETLADYYLTGAESLDVDLDAAFLWYTKALNILSKKELTKNLHEELKTKVEFLMKEYNYNK